MAVTTTRAREDSYVRALMYLGPRPRKPIRQWENGDEVGLAPEEYEQFLKRLQYEERAERYFLEHVWQTEPRRDDTWLADFYHWQRENAADLHVCKKETHHD